MNGMGGMGGGMGGGGGSSKPSVSKVGAGMNSKSRRMLKGKVLRELEKLMGKTHVGMVKSRRKKPAAMPMDDEDDHLLMEE
jgi:hypothetical protein